MGLAAVVLSLAIPAAAMAQTTAMQARDTALQITNGGIVMGLEQVSEAGASMFHIIVDNNVRFNVFVAVASGDVVRITTEQMPGNQWSAGQGWHSPSHGGHSPSPGWGSSPSPGWGSSPSPGWGHSSPSPGGRGGWSSPHWDDW